MFAPFLCLQFWKNRKKKKVVLAFYSKPDEVKSVPSYWSASWQYACVETWLISIKFHTYIFVLIYELIKGFRLPGLHLLFWNLGVGGGVNKKEKGLVSFQDAIFLVGLLERKNATEKNVRYSIWNILHCSLGEPELLKNFLFLKILEYFSRR